ncbi:MAG: hypothetical protein Q7U04_10680 [Bacteriovorax sp.]|nr:hypothetical protein [Bacteriovorax sp.]
MNNITEKQKSYYHAHESAYKAIITNNCGQIWDEKVNKIVVT